MEKLSKEERTTSEISSAALEKARDYLQGLKFGSLTVVVKNGYIMNWKLTIDHPERSRKLSFEERNDLPLTL